MKAGGPNQVISQADAKKMGLIKTTTTAPAVTTDKAKTTGVDKKITGVAGKEEKKLSVAKDS